MISTIINFVTAEFKFDSRSESDIFYIKNTCVARAVVFLWFTTYWNRAYNSICSYKFVIMNVSYSAIRPNLKFSINSILLIRILYRCSDSNE